MRWLTRFAGPPSFAPLRPPLFWIIKRFPFFLRIAMPTLAVQPLAESSALAAFSAEKADPFWIGWIIAPVSSGGAAGQAWGRDEILTLDQRARAAHCLEKLRPAGIFGAAMALFAASPQRAFGLARPVAEKKPLQRLLEREPAAGAFTPQTRRSLLAKALRLWRAGRRAGLALAPEEHFALAELLFEETVWDEPRAAGQWSETQLGKQSKRASAFLGWEEAPRYSCALFLRLWLEDAHAAGGDELAGRIIRLFLDRRWGRNRWTDRAWALAGPECAKILRWDLPVPAPEKETLVLPQASARVRERLLPHQSTPLWPLHQAWIAHEGEHCATQWRQMAAWRGLDPLAAIEPGQLRPTALAVLDVRLKEGFSGQSIEQGQLGKGRLGILCGLFARNPELAQEHAEGSMLWLWALRAKNGPAAGPLPHALGEGGGQEDEQGEIDMRVYLDRFGLRSYIGIGVWLRGLGASPFARGPDGESPLDKIRRLQGFGRLAAQWEADALDEEIGGAGRSRGSLGSVPGGDGQVAPRRI